MKNRPYTHDVLEKKITIDGSVPSEAAQSYDRLISGIYEKALVAEDLSEFFSECLKTIGETLGVSRIFLYEYREDSLVLKSVHEWTGGRLPAGKDFLMNIPRSRVPWWMNAITANEIIKYSDIDDIPSAFERRVLKYIGIKSLIAVPLFLSKRFYGFLGIADNMRNRTWDNGITDIIKAIAQIMTGVLSRKRAEEALADEKERLAVTIKSLADGVIAVDRQGKITLMNSMAEKLTGWSFDEARLKHITDVVYLIDEKTRELSHFPAKCSNDCVNEESTSFNSILVSREGAERLVSTIISPLLDHLSKFVGSVLVFRDVTGERTLQHELQKIQKIESLGNLASGLAHDYNNILTSVIGNISLAKMRGNTPEEIQEYLEEAEKGLMRATGLTRRLASFSRDDGISHRREVDLRQLIEETSVFSLYGSNCVAETRIDENLWKVTINEMQIGQVFHNIIVNAIQAMPDGGKITITARNVYVESSQSLPLNDGRYVRIFISDTGPGIPHGIRDRIFEPFFTTKVNSHGLGLAACYSIIKSHYGHITFQSFINEGTTFTLFIPAHHEYDSHAVPEAAPCESGTPAFSKKGKILLFYDSETSRLMATNILKAMGYTIHQSHTIEESISRIQDAMTIGSPFDLLVIDVHEDRRSSEMIHKITAIDKTLKILIIDEHHAELENHSRNDTNIIVTRPQKITHLSQIIKSMLTGEAN